MAASTTQCLIPRLPTASPASAAAARTSEGVSCSPRAAALWKKDAALRWTPSLPRGLRRRGSYQHSSPFWGSFEEDNSANLLCPALLAKRKQVGGNGNQEDEEEELDEDLRLGLNEISNEAVKVMLSDDDRLVDALREKVDELGEYLVQEGQIDAAKFMLIVRGMLDHEVYPQKDDLTGAYKKAFDKIAIIIEDSGWLLKQPGADVGGAEMVDDELMPPVLNTQY